MLTTSSTIHQPNLFGTDLLRQLDGSDSLLKLAFAIPWHEFDKALSVRHKQAVCDHGYRGKREVNGTQIILPGKALKKDSRYQKDKKRKLYRRRAAIEPIIGHLKSDYRMARNYLKGALGDHINLLLAAVAWNLKQWLLAIFWLFFPWRKLQVSRIL